jgi:5-methylcytosine-specific restriction endonuclease McrA
VVTENWKFEVHKRDNFTCQRCGAKEDPKHPTFQVHHVVFKCNGGSNNLNNLQLLCPECHRKLHNSNPVGNSRKHRSKKRRR